MSATLMGAVLSCGPKKGSMRYALVAIADNSDDYGFACPSVETIAEKACCDARTAMRLVQALEREGWMRVVRRVLFGKGSVYFIDIAKLGVTVNPKMRKSPLHGEVERMLAKKVPAVAPKVESGDNLSPENIAAPKKSGDNPQGGQVTKEAESGDKKPVPILINRCEPLLNPDKENPLPPSRPKGDCVSNSDELAEAVRKVMRELDISERRMAAVIARAIQSYRTKIEGNSPDCVTIANVMVRARRDYLELNRRNLLSYPVGPKKFFALGMWVDDRTWALDKQELARQRRL